MKRFLILSGLIACVVFHGARAEDFPSPAADEYAPTVHDSNNPDDNYLDYLTQTPTVAPELICAQRVYVDALRASAARTGQTLEVDEYGSESDIQYWVATTFHKPDVIRKVLACLEPDGFDDEKVATIPSVAFTFPGGREVVVDYSVPVKFLRQRLLLAEKRPLPGGPSERIGPDAEWANTEPAWYAIMVVQKDTMQEFAGEDANGTISLKYIEDNIDKFYPENSNGAGWNLGGLLTVPMCTSKSALADDGDIVNMAARRTTGETKEDERDTNMMGIAGGGNDYYIAGDVNLQWIAWTQIIGEIVLTIATWGAGEVAVAGAKAARTGKIYRGLRSNMKVMREVPEVVKFEKLGISIAHGERNIEKIKDGTKILETGLSKADEIAKIEKEILALKNEQSLLMKDAKVGKQVGEFAEHQKQLLEIMKYAKQMKAWRIPQRGNAIARGWRGMKAYRTSWKAINGGSKTLNKAAKVARAGMKSGRVRDYLFHATMKAAAMGGKALRDGALLYGILRFGADFYDWTDTETGDFTSNLKFKPLLLLSADDLEGQENVVNHGMWMMWAGDSTGPADDDAAYLQAMDFATKFHQDMAETQDDYMFDNSARDARVKQGAKDRESQIEKNNAKPKGERIDQKPLSQNGRLGGFCDVDIYVVRPIIRNPNDENPELYYLIMNDEPWRVRSDRE